MVAPSSGIFLIKKNLISVFALKCQVCESENQYTGIKTLGVCKDENDNGESRECQPHEGLCFFTKTGIIFEFIIKILDSKLDNFFAIRPEKFRY